MLPPGSGRVDFLCPPSVWPTPQGRVWVTCLPLSARIFSFFVRVQSFLRTWTSYSTTKRNLLASLPLQRSFRKVSNRLRRSSGVAGDPPSSRAFLMSSPLTPIFSSPDRASCTALTKSGVTGSASFFDATNFLISSRADAFSRSRLAWMPLKEDTKK